MSRNMNFINSKHSLGDSFLEELAIEGLRAKRAFVGFWTIFIFSQDRANFSQTDLF